MECDVDSLELRRYRCRFRPPAARRPHGAPPLHLGVELRLVVAFAGLAPHQELAQRQTADMRGEDAVAA
jgi:hypothetical protein